MAAIVLPAPRATRAEVRIEYSLHHLAAENRWRITVTVNGLDAAPGQVMLVLDDWGEWAADKTLHPRVVEPSRRSRPMARLASQFPVQCTASCA
jgi:hypothetical protein